MSWHCFLMGIQCWCLFAHWMNQFWKFPYFIYVYMIYALFLTQIQWSLWLCNHEGVQVHHLIWVSSAINFYFAFNWNGYFTIRANIVAIYNMGIIRMDFSFHMLLKDKYSWNTLRDKILQLYKVLKYYFTLTNSVIFECEFQNAF